MPWVKIDTDFPDHPKLLRCQDSTRALGVMTALLCYCRRYLTDGFVPERIALIYNGDIPDLVSVRLLHEVEGGFVINDYLEWQQSRESVESKRCSDRMRKSVNIPRGFRADSARIPTHKSIEEDKDLKPIVEKVIGHLNQRTGKGFKPTSDKTKTLVRARLNEGFTDKDFIAVIDNKCADWLTDPKMSKFLRPETLFGTKFEGYLNERRSAPIDDFDLPGGGDGDR